MMHNTDIRNGAHVVFFRESCTKIRENQERLYKEAQYVHDVATYLDTELSNFYERTDLTPIERKRYKYHLAKCEGEYSHVPNHQEDDVIKNLPLLPADNVEWKLVDIHVDFNPFEGRSGKNKSYVAYKSFVPWLKGWGFRVWSRRTPFVVRGGEDFFLKINKDMKEVKFKIWYDDQPNDVVDKIASQLKSYGLEVIELDGGDGFMEYEIKPLK